MAQDETSENLSMKVEATKPCEENLKGNFYTSSIDSSAKLFSSLNILVIMFDNLFTSLIDWLYIITESDRNC